MIAMNHIQIEQFFKITLSHSYIQKKNTANDKQ